MLGKKSPDKLTEREQVAKRREEVLSRGRKFKYPLQYAKHRVAIIATAISVVALVAIGLISYAALYVFGSSNDVLYRATEFFPVPVAEVAGEQVRFFDYLLLYRSSIATQSQTAEDFPIISAEYKQSSLRSAEQYAYAEKLARELDITVTDDEVQQLFDAHRRVGGTDRSEQSFLKIISDNFGLDKGEYLHLLRLLLVRMKVSAAIDDSAKDTLARIESALATSDDLSAIANDIGDNVSYEDTGGLIGLDNIDGGRSTVAFDLEVDEISAPFISTNGDCYYIVKLLEKTTSEISYASLRIPFTEFTRRFTEIIDSGAYTEYITITVPEDNTEEDTPE